MNIAAYTRERRELSAAQAHHDRQDEDPAYSRMNDEEEDTAEEPEE